MNYHIVANSKEMPASRGKWEPEPSGQGWVRKMTCDDEDLGALMIINAAAEAYCELDGKARVEAYGPGDRKPMWYAEAKP